MVICKVDHIETGTKKLKEDTQEDLATEQNKMKEMEKQHKYFHWGESTCI